MKYLMVMVGNDGFTKEEEIDKSPKNKVIFRRFINAWHLLPDEDVPDVPYKDRTFHLRDIFHALGKNIAYYKE